MSRFANTRGQQVLSPYYCDRCKQRGVFSEMREDGDKPGMWVHITCSDQLDPYKLPPRSPDNVVVPNPRPNDGFIASASPVLTPDDTN